MHTKKIMFFDIDGTLLPFTHEYVSEKMMEGLRQLKENGVKVGIATGRQLAAYDKLFADLPLDFSITSNGREVRRNGEILYQQAIPLDVLKRMIAFDDKYHVGLYFASSHSSASYNGINEDGVSYLENLHSPIPEIDKNFHLENEIYQSMIFCDEIIEEIFRETFPELVCVRHKNNGIDVLAAGPMKEQGIKIVLDEFGFSKKDALAFGDGLNDLGMFEYIDGVALGVAHPDLLALSVAQIDTVENDGIHTFLKEQKYI